MIKNTVAARVANGLKQLLITTLIALILYFFMTPVIQLLPWILPIMQFLLIFMFTVCIYVPFWEYGDRDRHLVQFGKKKKDLLYGLKIGLICISPYLLASVFLLLAKLGVEQWTLLVYRLVNIQFIYLIDLLIPLADVAAAPWGIVILCMIFPLYTAIVAEAAYCLGYHEISLKEKILYVKK